MKTFSGLALGVLLGLSLAPQLSAAPQFERSRDQNQDRDRVCVYQDINYQGWEECYSAGDEVADLKKHRNAISSIRVYGRARVTVYENEDFEGKSAEFSSDVRDLGLRSLAGSKSWSDRIQSLRVGSDFNGQANGRDRNRDQSNRFPAQRQQVNDGICVYDRPDYEGREQCWSTGSDLSDLGRSGDWSDKISSIRVFGRTTAVVYRDIGFNGDSITVDRDIPDLSRVSGRGFKNWDRQISSVQIDGDRGRFGTSRSRNRRWR
jgi:hypothetical protein